MPTWSQIFDELSEERNRNPFPFDWVRRKYLTLLNKYTDRNVILYATNWTTTTGLPIDPGAISITDEDIQGLMEVVHGLNGGKGLDLILHSPGGVAEATEAFVTYLRTKFNDIRVIIPYAAMSAATMLACSANKIVMGKHSFMGPVDPQMILQKPRSDPKLFLQKLSENSLSWLEKNVRILTI
jgi:ClpP class serine protease